MTQVSQFLFSREELRPISRWILFTGFLSRGDVQYSVHQEWSVEDTVEKTTPRVCVLEHKRYDRCHINHFPQTHSPQKFTESW